MYKRLFQGSRASIQWCTSNTYLFEALPHFCPSFLLLVGISIKLMIHNILTVHKRICFLIFFYLHPNPMLSCKRSREISNCAIYQPRLKLQNTACILYITWTVKLQNILTPLFKFFSKCTSHAYLMKSTLSLPCFKDTYFFTIAYIVYSHK